MKTSYFAKYRDGANGVSIALFPPKGYKGRRYMKLAPPEWLLRAYKSKPDEEQYKKDYDEHVLSKLDPRQVYDDLGENAVLLCYEAPGKFCHRRLVAEWLERCLGIKIPELDAPDNAIGGQSNNRLFL